MKQADKEGCQPMLSFIIGLLFLHRAESAMLWSDKPIRYKQYFEVQTHEMPMNLNSSKDPLIVYATYVLDDRYPMGSKEGLVYFVYTDIFDYAEIVHENAVEWVIRHYSHMRIPKDHYPVVPTETEEKKEGEEDGPGYQFMSKALSILWKSL